MAEQQEATATTTTSAKEETIKEHLQGVYTEKDWEDIHCLSPEVIWKIKQTFEKPSLI